MGKSALFHPYKWILEVVAKQSYFFQTYNTSMTKNTITRIMTMLRMLLSRDEEEPRRSTDSLSF